MEKRDVSQVLKLYTAQLERCQVKHKMSQDEIMHYIMPREGFMWSWVVENMVDGKLQITDFWSMKRQINVVLNKESKHTDIKQAYIWYYGLSKNTYENMVKTLMH